MNPVKIYPSAAELTTITNLIYCTESGCSSVFKSQSNLNLHLAKRHKKEELANYLTKQDTNREYHCPDANCIYHSCKFFKSVKLLKQHYLKVHTSKDVLCETCGKGFATEAARNSHEEYCGVVFKCSDCEAVYTCYDTLTTHGRRKKHKILPKVTFKPGVKASESAGVLQNASAKILLPKPASATQLVILIKTNDKGSQTDLYEGQPKCKSRRTNNEEVETQRNKQPQCAETQTIGDYHARKSNSDVSSSSSTESLSRKTTDTQTAVVVSTSKSCNTSLDMNELQYDGDVMKTTLGTQTLEMLTSLFENQDVPEIPNNNFEFIHSNCQNSFNENFDPANFFNCNTETQTESILNNDFDILTQDFYANMCTQTCEDILSVDMEFNHSHTQTVMDDILRSVGSQTNLFGACRDIAHNETQTDLVFKQMLEEINA